MGMQATLLFDFGHAGVISRTEMFGDDLIQQLSHASIRATGCLFKVGLGLGRDPPRVDFTLS
jgi:hypothetical protein